MSIDIVHIVDDYEEAVQGMIEEHAPRRFAIFQDYGDQIDGRVAAWGMAFDDRADILDAGGSTWLSTTSPDDVLPRYARAPGVTSRVIWVDTP